MLTFIGLGLYDQEDISLKGLAAVREADVIYLENYTSHLMGVTVHTLENQYHRPIRILGREDVEIHPEPILEAAMAGNVVFLTAGDSMVSTTHADLRLRAHGRGIKTRIIHGASIQTAVCGLSGLQNYRFGKSCSLPFPHGRWAPETPFDTIAANLSDNLHTLVYLDIRDNRYMRIGEAVAILEEISHRRDTEILLYVGIARAGSPDVDVFAGSAAHLLSHDFGDPLHILVVPAGLHLMEEEYIRAFAGYDPS